MSDHVVASIRADCARCGPVEVAMSGVRLVMADPHVDSGTPSLVEFTCPRCGTSHAVAIDERTTRLMAQTDVVLVSPPPSQPPSRKRVGGVPEAR